MAIPSAVKTIFVPPLIAVAIYLISIYVLLPIYRSRQRYAHYLPIQLLSSPSENQPGILQRLRTRALDAFSPSGRNQWWQRRGSAASTDDLYGDEELEEGVSGEYDVGEGAADGRRLSRELEVGFRDDSDEEDGDRRNIGRSTRR